MNYTNTWRDVVGPQNASATPHIKNININGIIAKRVEYVMLLKGLPESQIENVSFSNITIESKSKNYPQGVAVFEQCVDITGICDESSVGPYCPKCLLPSISRT